MRKTLFACLLLASLAAGDGGYTLRNIVYLGASVLPRWYLDRYQLLNIGQVYSEAELSAEAELLRVRMESDARILRAEPDLVYHREEQAVELYLNVSENLKPISLSGQFFYLSATWRRALGPLSRLNAALGYNKQAAEVEWPHLAQLPLGLELAAGHQPVYPFSFNDHIYTDFFARHFVYWHPLPEIKWGLVQRVDLVRYWQQAGLNLYPNAPPVDTLWPRWLVGVQFEALGRSLAAVQGLGVDFRTLIYWRPLGQFKGAWGSDSQLKIFGDFGWLFPQLTLRLRWNSARGEWLHDRIGQRQQLGHVSPTVTLRFAFLPWHDIEDLFDLGFSLVGQTGFTQQSWQQVRLAEDLIVNVMAGPYLRFNAPMSLAVAVDLGLTLRPSEQWGFAWNLEFTGKPIS